MSELRDDLAVRIANAVTDQPDWAHLAADSILADYIIVPCKPVPQSERPVCPACGTWQCATCGYRRIGAFRFVEQTCKLPCTSTSGVFLDTRHSNYGKYLDHLEALREYTR